MGVRIGIADTTFARVDMAAHAIDEIMKKCPDAEIVRLTVPGIKDLPLACKTLLEKEICDICLAIGMAGKEAIDTQCAHEASMGLIQVQLMVGKPVLGVIVHEFEARNDKDLYEICVDRARKHAVNAVIMATKPEVLTKYAGKGLRQGSPHAGPMEV